MSNIEFIVIEMTGDKNIVINNPMIKLLESLNEQIDNPNLFIKLELEKEEVKLNKEHIRKVSYHRKNKRQ